MLLGVLVLTAAAWLRGAEYDEQYTLFLTAGTPRPDWPETVFPAGRVAALQAGYATLADIARDLRSTDVHPPLYFWAVSLWRDAFGPGLFTARLLSVLCGSVSLSLIGLIARRRHIPAAPAMLFTLGCYGFVYTNAVARGFAPAQMLMLLGVLLLLQRRALLAGVCLGAACCCNYLAVFVVAAAILLSGAWLAAVAAVPFLVIDAWFFAAQHAARTGQFPPFQIGPSLLRLAEYQTAAVFGGLPLYADGIWRIGVGGIVGLAAVSLLLCIRWGRLVPLVLATPIGLLLLGVVFDNTPIELRYLSFGLPFVGLLIAACSKIVPRRLIAAVQIASIAGLLLSPRTMQPARSAAIEAGRLTGDPVVLLPRGNDGVGIVGAFGIEAPPGLRLMLVTPGDPIADRIAPYRRVVVAALAQDRDSSTVLEQLHAMLAPPNWRRVSIGSNLEQYERTDAGE